MKRLAELFDVLKMEWGDAAYDIAIGSMSVDARALVFWAGGEDPDVDELLALLIMQEGNSPTAEIDAKKRLLDALADAIATLNRFGIDA